MEPNSIRAGTVEIDRRHCLFDIPAKLFPGVSLRKDVFGQALGAVAAISLLSNLENKFGHNLTLYVPGPIFQANTASAGAQKYPALRLILAIGVPRGANPL